ncbi:MAG: Hsp20/alpha crystallin family protein [Armatimonadetes bacterium]|nr:Hsp20/alpha crystallin family protein [Armatimonadota bacterium]
MRFGDVLELQEQFDRVFRDAIAAGKSRPAAPSFAPPTDVTRTADEYIVRCDVPGVTAESVRVVADEGVLRVAGKRQPPVGRLLRSERKAGSFARVIPLPSDADVSKVSASLKQGVLTVKVGRLEARPKGPVEVPIRVENG